MSDESIYAAELRAAAGLAHDAASRELLNRTAERLLHDENLDIEELLLLSVAAMAIQTPHELESWGRSVARRHEGLTTAVDALLRRAATRRPDGSAPALDGAGRA